MASSAHTPYGWTDDAPAGSAPPESPVGRRRVVGEIDHASFDDAWGIHDSPTSEGDGHDPYGGDLAIDDEPSVAEAGPDFDEPDDDGPRYDASLEADEDADVEFEGDFDDEPDGDYDPSLDVGLTGRALAAAGLFGTLALVGVNLLLTGGLTYFFDLSFVVACVLIGLGVRGYDLFTAAILPPLAYAAAIITVAAISAEAFVVGGERFDRVVLTGLVMHAGALAFGYGSTLLIVVARAFGRRMRA